MGISLRFTAGFSAEPQVLCYKSARDVRMRPFTMALLPLLFDTILRGARRRSSLFCTDYVTGNGQAVGTAQKSKIQIVIHSRFEINSNLARAHYFAR